MAGAAEVAVSRSYTVEHRDEGKRLDAFLARAIEGLGRTAARRLIADGRVRVNERRIKKGDRVRGGDQVRVEGAIEIDWQASPDPDLTLSVLYEDADVVVVDKPAGIPTHPLRPGETRTLAGALLARYPEMAAVGYSPREPGILHRLDTDTSGVLVAARNAKAFAALREDLTAGRLDKEYLALVVGEMTGTGTIAFALAPSAKSRKKMAVCRDERSARRLGARPAETPYRVERAGAGLSLVRVQLGAAQRHQIRAHLAAAGHPIVGDALYGDADAADATGATGLIAQQAAPRHLLHATRVRLRQPTTLALLDVQAPLPADFLAVLDTLPGSGG